MKAKKIWLNGEYVDWDKATIHLTAHTLHYGDGVFEGIRFYETEKGTCIFRLREHVKRLFNSALALEMKIPYSITEIEKAIMGTIRKNKLDAGYIRPLVFYGGGSLGLDTKSHKVETAIIVVPFPKYFKKNTIKVMTSSFIRIHPRSTITTAKICGHYVNSILANMEAKKNGFDEALLLDFKGDVTEGSGENLFFVKDGVIKTSSLEDILPGITRDAIIELAVDLGYEVDEEEFNIIDLERADEIFFCGTAAEITPISQVNDFIINKKEIGGITLHLQEKFFDVINGKEKKYKNWLKYI
jgi:branched-chain amino acid aminotransferase